MIKHSAASVLWMLLTGFSRRCASTDPVDWAAITVSDNPPLQYKGDGTFYGKNQDNQGACGFSSSAATSLGMPWTSGTTLTVAVNDFQYAEGLSCGMCVKFRGVGTGIGTTPVPQTWQYALVNNRCPECAPGSLDLALNGTGRWQIQWVPVPCNVGQSTFFYHVVSPLSNPYYFAFSVSNTRVPLKNVELETDGNWASLRRDVSNSWNANGGIYHCPLHIRLTSVLGDVVEDWVPSNQGGQGTAQFPTVTPDPSGAAAGALPLTPDYPSITSGNSAPVPVHWNAPNGTWVATTTSNPAPSGAAVRQISPAAQASATAGSAAASAARSSSSSSPSSPSPSSSSPSSSSTSSSSSPSSNSGSLAQWQQCGGTYRCTSNCADAAYSDKQCSSGSTCMRYDSTWWQCRPDGQGFNAGPSAPSSAEATPSGGSSSSGGSSVPSSSSESQGSTSSSDSSSSSSISNGGSSAAANAYAGGGVSSGGTLAYGGNLNSGSSSSSGGGASASASAGRRMLRS